MRTVVDRMPETVDECQYANDYTYCRLKRFAEGVYDDCDLCKDKPCQELIGIVSAAVQYGIDI